MDEGSTAGAGAGAAAARVGVSGSDCTAGVGTGRDELTGVSGTGIAPMWVGGLGGGGIDVRPGGASDSRGGI